MGKDTSIELILFRNFNLVKEFSNENKSGQLGTLHTSKTQRSKCKALKCVVFQFLYALNC